MVEPKLFIDSNVSPVTRDRPVPRVDKAGRPRGPVVPLICRVCRQPVIVREIRNVVRQSTNSRFTSYPVGIVSRCGPHGFGWVL